MKLRSDPEFCNYIIPVVQVLVPPLLRIFQQGPFAGITGRLRGEEKEECNDEEDRKIDDTAEEEKMKIMKA